MSKMFSTGTPQKSYRCFKTSVTSSVLSNSQLNIVPDFKGGNGEPEYIEHRTVDSGREVGSTNPTIDMQAHYVLRYRQYFHIFQT